MYEVELHDLWRKKNLPIELRLVDGRPLSIINFGHYNDLYAGPDFSMGIIHLDQLDMVGPIEIHVKSSDWYRHKHHLDKNYNNVILHVVYDYDIEVIQNNRVIPTLELKNIFDSGPGKKSLSSKNLPCSSFLHEIDFSVIEKLKLKALERKLSLKFKSLNLEEEVYKKHVFYKLIANAFAFGVNSVQFDMLTERVPVESLLTLSPIERLEVIRSASDAFLPKQRIDPKAHIIWHKKGLMPSGFPAVRVNQFALIVSHLLFQDDFVEDIQVLSMKPLKRKLLDISGIEGINISASTINHLILNCFVPFQYYNAQNTHGLTQMKQILKSLKADQNKFTRSLKSQGFSIENAFDSQALIAQYKHSCSHKKCLSCDVGKMMLNRLI